MMIDMSDYLRGLASCLFGAMAGVSASITAVAILANYSSIVVITTLLSVTFAGISVIAGAQD